MSALDKLLGKTAAQAEESKGLFGGPLAAMLSSIIPREQLEQLSKDAGGAMQYIKDSFSLLIRGNSLITDQNAMLIKQNQKIMAHLGIESNDDGDGSVRD